MNEEITVATSGEMRDLGCRLATLLRAGDVIILSGPLGAGKTTFTQGIGEGLSVRGPVTSPTFVISRVHPRAGGGSGPALVHVDAYRLGSVLELDDLDLDADTDTAVTVVEWGEGLAEGLADDRLEVTISAADDAHAGGAGGGSLEGDRPRTVRISGVGVRWQDIQLARADVIDRL